MNGGLRPRGRSGVIHLSHGRSVIALRLRTDVSIGRVVACRRRWGSARPHGGGIPLRRLLGAQRAPPRLPESRGRVVVALRPLDSAPGGRSSDESGDTIGGTRCTPAFQSRNGDGRGPPSACRRGMRSGAVGLACSRAPAGRDLGRYEVSADQAGRGAYDEHAKHLKRAAPKRTRAWTSGVASGSMPSGREISRRTDRSGAPWPAGDAPAADAARGEGGPKVAPASGGRGCACCARAVRHRG